MQTLHGKRCILSSPRVGDGIAMMTSFTQPLAMIISCSGVLAYYDSQSISPALPPCAIVVLVPKANYLELLAGRKEGLVGLNELPPL